jgi:heptosyltransferase I
MWFRGNRLMRFIDRYAGIPLVAGLSMVRRRRTLPPNPRRIGLMKSVSLGDLVLMTGVMRDVRAAFPGATLVLINGDDNRALGRMMMEEGDEQVVISPVRLRKSIADMRAAKLDILLDFGAWVRYDAILTALSGAKFTVGFETDGHSRHHAYDRSVHYSGAIHEIDNNRNIARAIGVDSASPPFIQATGPAELPASVTKPFVAFHPWPGGFKSWAREWAPERWIEFATVLRDRKRSVVVTGGPGDAARSEELVTALAAAGVNAWSSAGKMPLSATAAMVHEAEAAVCVNTGVMHLAAAIGTPTIGLHGPTSPVRWEPLGRSTLAVVTRTPGCGFLNLGYEYDGHRLDCMDGIPVSDVVAAYETLLRKT